MSWSLGCARAGLGVPALCTWTWQLAESAAGCTAEVTAKYLVQVVLGEDLSFKLSIKLHSLFESGLSCGLWCAQVVVKAEKLR